MRRGETEIDPELIDLLRRALDSLGDPLEETQPPQQRTSAPGARTVPYIDDDAGNLLLIERLLSRHPRFRLLQAPDGTTGLELARRELPDVILLDLILPDTSGADVLVTLASDPATNEIPVIVVSSEAYPATIDQILACGVRRYLTKPLDLDKLIAALDGV